MAFNEALTIRGEETVCVRGRSHLSEGDHRCACLENIDYKFLDIPHVSTWENTHTHILYIHTDSTYIC